MVGRATSATNQISALGRSPEEAATETGHKSGKSLMGYVQAGADHQRKFDIQWQEFNQKQHEKFGPKSPVASFVGKKRVLSEIVASPVEKKRVLSEIVASPVEKKRVLSEIMVCEFSREKPAVTPETAAAEQRFEERLESFQDFQIFLKRAQSKGKTDAELVHEFLLFQRYERLLAETEL